jgi:5-methylcytosine-specific restriction protein A
MALTDITAAEVARAIEEFDRLGRDAFLQAYGFAPARRYLLVHDGRRYDSKAIVGAAHGFLPGQGPLRARDFSGGADHAVGLLKWLGFVVVDEQTTEVGAYDALIERVGGLRVSRASGQPALYQPITLLWAIGRARRGDARLLSWSETGAAVGELLTEYGMRGERRRPDYPVLALHHAGLWELEGHTGAVPRSHGDSEVRRWFTDHQPRGGLTAPVYGLLLRSGEARLAVIDTLLGTFFEGLDYGPLLSAVGLYDDQVADDLDTGGDEATGESALVTAAQYERLCLMAERHAGENHGRRATGTVHNPIRSAAARRAVLARSQGDCENPRCTGQPTDVTDAGQPILEVDHVQDLAQGGPDHPSQMVALCPNCHAIKTRGSTKEELRTLLLDVAKERHDRMRTTEDL